MNITTFLTEKPTLSSIVITRLINSLPLRRLPYSHGEVAAKIRNVLKRDAERYADVLPYLDGNSAHRKRRVYNLPHDKVLSVLLEMPFPIYSKVLSTKKSIADKEQAEFSANFSAQCFSQLVKPAPEKYSVIQSLKSNVPQGEYSMKMSTLTLNNTGEVLTMSSLEMVSYINSTRKAGEAELRHFTFLAKVPSVLNGGEKNFLSSYFSAQNKTLPMYNFPKREAMLMAMSYSYELQAQVFDAWESAEATLVKPKQNVFVLPDFTNPGIAARAWAEQFEATVLLSNEIKEAQPKIAFHDAVVQNETTYSLAEAAKILDLGPIKFNKIMRASGYLMKSNVAYQHYIALGIFSLRFSGFILENGTIAPATTRVTSKGIAFLQKKLAVAA